MALRDEFRFCSKDYFVGDAINGVSVLHFVGIIFTVLAVGVKIHNGGHIVEQNSLTALSTYAMARLVYSMVVPAMTVVPSSLRARGRPGLHITAVMTVQVIVLVFYAGLWQAVAVHGLGFTGYGRHPSDSIIETFSEPVTTLTEPWFIGLALVATLSSMFISEYIHTLNEEI